MRSGGPNDHQAGQLALDRSVIYDRAPMAQLKHHPSGVQHYLTPRHIIGRAASCHLCIAEPNVSGVHAEIVWNGSGWQVQDLGSRNGTFIDGRRLSIGEQAPLIAGATLTLGGPAHRYSLASDAPPRLMAIPDRGAPILADDGLLCLPSSDACELSVFHDHDDRWVIESDQGKRTIEEQEIVTAGGRSWRVSLPASAVQTHDAECRPTLELDDIRLEFAVSRDGEHVTVRQLHRSGMTELEYRSHLFLLVELARCRLEDAAQPGLPEGEHGWVHRDDLLQRLDIDYSMLNVWIFRLRKQFAELGFQRAAGIIQRRTGSQQLRIGVRQLHVDRA